MVTKRSDPPTNVRVEVTFSPPYPAPALPQAFPLFTGLRVGGSDEADASGQAHVEVERGANAVDVVETDAVGVTTNRPNQDDVALECASLVRPG
jgi:hypothetical protein